MAVIHTNRNQVHAYQPEEGDCFVRTYLRGSEGLQLLTTRGIEHYQAAVEWAVGIADQMAMYIVVMPITAQEFADANRERLESHLAALTDQERGELRHVAAASMLEVLRDCPDPAVRADAYEVLKTMRIVT